MINDAVRFAQWCPIYSIYSIVIIDSFTMCKLFTIWSSNISTTYTSSIPSHPRVHWPRIIHYTLQLSLHWQTRASRACCCWPWLFTSRPSPRFPPRWPRLARGSTSSPAFWLALGTLVHEGIGWYLLGVVVFIDERNSHWLDVHTLFCNLMAMLLVIHNGSK